MGCRAICRSLHPPAPHVCPARSHGDHRLPPFDQPHRRASAPVPLSHYRRRGRRDGDALVAGPWPAVCFGNLCLLHLHYPQCLLPPVSRARRARPRRHQGYARLRPGVRCGCGSLGAPVDIVAGRRTIFIRDSGKHSAGRLELHPRFFLQPAPLAGLRLSGKRDECGFSAFCALPRGLRIVYCAKHRAPGYGQGRGG
ncbi:MAG: hypothetical protein BWY77_01850 [bacterium ADurb.Bin431]|nr:MAG: hypothetical protein BWY77_01850 [bacterium ADurb.Bin431]